MFIGLIVYAVRSERLWFRGPELGELLPSSVINADEREELITRRTRRAAGRARLLQRSQIGYADAVADPAPRAELDALAAQVQRHREPVTGVPGQQRRRPDTGHTSAHPDGSGRPGSEV